MPEEADAAARDDPSQVVLTRVARPATLRGHTAAIKDVAFSPDGAILASADDRGVVRLWDARTGRRTGRLGRRDLAMGVMSLAFSPDARILAAAAPELTLWHLTPAATAATLHTQTRFDRVWSVAYSPAGDLVATGNSHDSVHLWDPRTRREIMTLTHPGAVFAVALSPDGATLASGGGYVRVWDIRTGQCRHVLTGHTGTIHGLAFSPDGQILASASVDYPGHDRTVRLWDVRTMRPVITLGRHHGTVSGVAFHPDGTHLASGSFDRTIRLWPIGLPIRRAPEAVSPRSSLGWGWRYR